MKINLFELSRLGIKATFLTFLFLGWAQIRSRLETGASDTFSEMSKRSKVEKNTQTPLEILEKNASQAIQKACVTWLLCMRKEKELKSIFIML